MKITDAEASVPGKGYRTQNDRYGSPLSIGDGGNWGERVPSLPMMEHGIGNTMERLEGQPGPGGPAIAGIGTSNNSID